MKIYSLPDITSAGALQQVSVTEQRCKWFQVQGKTVATTSRVGDSLITANRGAEIAIAGAQFSPPVAEELNQYNLQDVYVLATSGDVFTILYAQ